MTFRTENGERDHNQISITIFSSSSWAHSNIFSLCGCYEILEKAYGNPKEL
jgi:hypothetical protein